MSKKFYVGVDNVARRGKRAYIGVNGVARKVKKIYVGDSSGVARLVAELTKPTVSFNANGGSGSISAISAEERFWDASDTFPTFTVPSNSFTRSGYQFTGWNSAANGSGTAYTVGQTVTLNQNITLYAQWIQLFNVTYTHTNHTNLYDNDETGHMECYALYINGELKPKFGTFNETSPITYVVPAGATIRVVCDDYRENDWSTKTGTCDVYWNGTSVANGYGGTEYTFTLTSNITVDFRWKISGSHVSFDARSWEDCYITTS